MNLESSYKNDLCSSYVWEAVCRRQMELSVKGSGAIKTEDPVGWALPGAEQLKLLK